MKLNLTATRFFMYILVVVVASIHLPTSEANDKLGQEKAWNDSRCSDFFDINDPRARFLAKKCSGKKGRWLRACIRSKNIEGHFDNVLQNFNVFREWKCYPAISSYFAKDNNKSTTPNRNKQKTIKTPKSKTTLPISETLKEEPVTNKSDSVSTESSKIPDLREQINNLEGRVSEMELLMKKLEIHLENEKNMD